MGHDQFGDTKVPCEFTGCATLKPFNRYTNRGDAIIGRYVDGLPFRSEFCPVVHHVEDLIRWNDYLYNEQNYKDIPLNLKDPYIKHE